MFAKGDYVVVWFDGDNYGAPGIVVGFAPGLSDDKYRVSVGGDVWSYDSSDLERLYRLEDDEEIVTILRENDCE